MNRLHTCLIPLLACLTWLSWTPVARGDEPGSAAFEEVDAEALGVRLEAFRGTHLSASLPADSPLAEEYLETGDPALLARLLPELFARTTGDGDETAGEEPPPPMAEDPELEGIFRHHAERMMETRSDPRKLAAALYLGDGLEGSSEPPVAPSEEVLEILAEQEAYEREHPTFLGISVDVPAEPADASEPLPALGAGEPDAELRPGIVEDAAAIGHGVHLEIPAAAEERPVDGSGVSTSVAALTAAKSCADPTPFWPPGPFQVSEYMRGTVTAVILYLDRRGGVWGPWEVDRQRRVTKFAHGVWQREARRRGSNLSFKIVEHHVNLRATGVPPERWTEAFMVYSSLSQLGVPFPGRNLRTENWARHSQRQRMRDLRQAAHHFRTRHRTDWAYLIFAVDRGWFVGLPTFRSGAGAYAYLNGGAVFLNSSAWEFIGANHYAMTHELGHVFGALDHYRGSGAACGDPGGYLGTPLSVHEDGRAAGCAGNAVDIMDRYSRVWLSGPMWAPVPITAVTRSQVGMTGTEQDPYLDLELRNVYRFNFRPDPLYLYEVRYEAEVGATRRVGPQRGDEPHPMSGEKTYVTPARLEWIDFKQPWKKYPDPGRWDRVRLRQSGSPTQVQCGTLIFGQWGKPIDALKVRVSDRSRHGSKGGWIDPRLTGAKIEGKNGRPISKGAYRVTRGSGLGPLLW